MNANETQRATGIASTKDEIIIFSLSSVLSLSLVIHAWYVGRVIWRKRQMYIKGRNRLMQDWNPPPGDHEQGV